MDMPTRRLVNSRTDLLVEVAAICYMIKTSSASSASHACNAEEQIKLKCGPMPNLMAAQPNVHGALCGMLLIKLQK